MSRQASWVLGFYLRFDHAFQRSTCMNGVKGFGFDFMTVYYHSGACICKGIFRFLGEPSDTRLYKGNGLSRRKVNQKKETSIVRQ
jgi:hypothetical protein